MSLMARGGSLFLACGGALFVACSGAPEPVSVARDEPISLGLFDLTVSRAEAVPDPPPAPLNTLHTYPGIRVVVVLVKWSGLDSLDDQDRQIFLESFLGERLTLVDAAERKYQAIDAMPEDYYHMRFPGGPVAEDWLVVFHVAEESDDFTLLVENPEPAEGEPRLSSVALGAVGGSS
jgi:hypothetical protein